MPENQIDQFLAAIRRIESGSFAGNYAARNSTSGALGAYQILPSNWPAWAREAGIPGADWRDRTAQDRVARFKMLQYYRRFGDWRLVAVAWFAGPGRAATAQQRGLSSVGALMDSIGTSVRTYVEAISEHMGELGVEAPPSSPTPVAPVETATAATPTEMPDPDSMGPMLTDMLNAISHAVAGGTRGILPTLAKPEVVRDKPTGGGYGDAV